MQTNHIRSAGAVAAVMAAAAVGYSLHPNTQQSALAEHNPPVEVRTVVIRRTIHVVHHVRVRPPVPSTLSAAAAPSQSGGQTSGQPVGQPVVSTAVRTSSSHHATAAAPTSTGQPVASSAPLTTSTSKHTAASTPSTTGGTSGSAPVTTRSSRSGSSGSGTAKPVTTRTSGGKGHGDDGGGDGSDN